MTTGLTPTPETDALAKFPWSLTYTITLAGHQITTDLLVKNTSTDKPFAFQALLHTYFAAPASSVAIGPLTGLTYIDKVGGGVERKETRELVDVRTYTDAVYKDASGHYSVRWSGGGADIKTIGFKDVVVWNPNKDAGSKIGDMNEGGWCVSDCFRVST